MKNGLFVISVKKEKTDYSGSMSNDVKQILMNDQNSFINLDNFILTNCKNSI